MRVVVFAWLVAVACVVGAESARAAPITYEWTADGGLLSANREALEAITGQSNIIFLSQFNLWATAGGGFGTFTYDSSPSGPTHTLPTGATLYTHAALNWASTLHGAGGNVIGTISADSGAAVVGNDNSGASLSDDLINVQTCLISCLIGGAEPTGYQGFTVGPWLSTFNALLWLGGDFLGDQSLPGMLPPVGAATRIASFGFLDLDSGSLNVQILAANLQISAVPVPEPSTFASLALGLAGLFVLRRLKLLSRAPFPPPARRPALPGTLR